jgi:hypothetical protein
MPAVMTVLLLAVLTAAPAAAQWPDRPEPALPRTSAGTVDLTAPAPRVNGRPNLQGLWMARPDPLGKRGGVENEILPRYFVNVGEDVKGAPTAIVAPPFTAALEERLKREGADDPIAQCKPAGVPRLLSVPTPFKFVETPGLVILLHEYDTTFRQIFTDGRDLPPDPQPAWMGYSVGRWEGDAFVVTSAGFRDHGWLDAMGHPHSDQLRVVERFRRIDLGHMQVDVTLTDPKALKGPISFTQHLELMPDTEIIEYFCSENEKDRAHYVTN